jgi:3'-5' exoribonuclease
LSFADNIDAKMETMKEALENVPEGSTDFTDYNRLFETRIRRASR